MPKIKNVNGIELEFTGPNLPMTGLLSSLDINRTDCMIISIVKHTILLDVLSISSLDQL